MTALENEGKRELKLSFIILKLKSKIFAYQIIFPPKFISPTLSLLL